MNIINNIKCISRRDKVELITKINLENKVFSQKPEVKPQVFRRYIDDIFIVCNSFDEIEFLKQEFKANSPLKFTYEFECNKKNCFSGYIAFQNRR